MSLWSSRHCCVVSEAKDTEIFFLKSLFTCFFCAIQTFLIRLYMSKSVSSIYNCECIFSLLYDIILKSSQKFILLQCLMICVAYLVTISRTWNFIVKYSVVWINKRIAEQHLIYIVKCNISLHTGATETF